MYNGRFGIIVGFGDPRQPPPGVTLLGTIQSTIMLLPIVEWEHWLTTMVGDYKFQR